MKFNLYLIIMITWNSRLHKDLEVRSSWVEGKWVYAKNDIKKGERLAIFWWSVMFIDEIKDLDESMRYYSMQIEERFVFGNKTSIPEKTDFFNHSCNPNAGFRGQIFLVAMRDISQNEEITFDYALIISESVWSDIVFQMDCNCGSVNCRNQITENDRKMPELRLKYKGYFSQYLAEKISLEDLGRKDCDLLA